MILWLYETKIVAHIFKNNLTKDLERHGYRYRAADYLLFIKITELKKMLTDTFIGDYIVLALTEVELDAYESVVKEDSYV